MDSLIDYLITLCVITGFFIAVIGFFIAVYAIGWAFSRGFHRAKREYVDELLQRGCEETPEQPLNEPRNYR